MDESKKLCPCADCASRCKPVFAALLIVIGLRMLMDQFTGKKNQAQEV